MSDLLCYDECSGIWFRSSEEQLRKMQNRVNELLESRKKEFTLDDIFDIINENLPEDKKIRRDIPWSSIPLRRGDHITYDGVRCQLNGEDVFILSFTSNTSIEDWVRAE